MITKDRVLIYGLEKVERVGLRRLATAGSLLLAVLLLAGAAVRMNNLLPGWVPLVGMDSGVAMCKAIAETAGAGRPDAAPVAQAELARIREVRALFADSRYEDIRIPGVAMMDLSAQFVLMQGGDAESGLGAGLALVGPMMTANAGLAGGCREHGYEIPAMQP
jgi:hypothetical protein